MRLFRILDIRVTRPSRVYFDSNALKTDLNLSLVQVHWDGDTLTELRTPSSGEEDNPFIRDFILTERKLHWIGTDICLGRKWPGKYHAQIRIPQCLTPIFPVMSTQFFSPMYYASEFRWTQLNGSWFLNLIQYVCRRFPKVRSSRDWGHLLWARRRLLSFPETQGRAKS